MKAIVLAAGVASRLRPLTDTIPKCLLDVGGRTILGRTLDGLRAQGVTDLILVTGYRDAQIRADIAEHHEDLHIAFVHNRDFAATNNIYSFWLALKETGDDDILLLDSDIVFDDRIIGALLHSGRPNCLAVTTGKALGEEEIKVRVDGNRAILQIGKDVPPAEAFGESIGIEKFSRDCRRSLFSIVDEMIVREGMLNVFYEAAFQRVIDSKTGPLAAVDVGELACIEIDTVDDLTAARMRVAPVIDKKR